MMRFVLTTVEQLRSHHLSRKAQLQILRKSKWRGGIMRPS